MLTLGEIKGEINTLLTHVDQSNDISSSKLMYSEQIHLTEKHNAPLPRKSTTCEIINNI